MSGAEAKVADRLEYYLSRTKQPPQIFRTLYDQLPLLIQTFEEIKTACEKEKTSAEQQKSLLKTVQGFVRLTKLIEAQVEDCLPLPDDSFLIKGKKATASRPRRISLRSNVFLRRTSQA